MENQTSVTYAEAGVDIVEGARAVDAIKDTVHSTYRPEVVGDIGGFGGLFSIAAAKAMARKCKTSAASLCRCCLWGPDYLAGRR